MKYFTEVRELDESKIRDILYFEDEKDADKYIEDCENDCLKKKNYLISKGKNIESFKKEKLKLNALNKLTDEERKILGL